MSTVGGFRCPFCGGPGPSDKEHVWAQWMRKSPGGRQILALSKGERRKDRRIDWAWDDAGRLTGSKGDPFTYNVHLPHVTVRVCKKCNGGWMSTLEQSAIKCLDPWITAGWPARLSTQAQNDLAAWATKSWMAYAVATGRANGPFTADERSSMAQHPEALDRIRIWMMHADAPTAHVGMGLTSWLVSPDAEPPDLTTTPDNTGFAFLAYNGIVWFAVLSPPFRPEFGEIVENLIDDLGHARRIWPPTGEAHFPQSCAPAETVSELLSIPTTIQSRTGMPTEGLTIAEMEQAHNDFLAGVEAWQLRARFHPEQLAQLERWQIEHDPDGYGKTWQPYKALGGIEWHGLRYESALEYYEKAQSFGATTHDIGSQTCDTLMFLGRYAEAFEKSQDIMAAGPNEWRDVFRDAILTDLVVHRRLERQHRQPRSGEFRIRVNCRTVRSARRFIKEVDALDGVSWAVLGTAIGPRTRLSTIMTSAYFSEVLPPWVVLSAHSRHRDDAVAAAVVSALAEMPELRDRLAGAGL